MGVKHDHLHQKISHVDEEIEGPSTSPQQQLDGVAPSIHMVNDIMTSVFVRMDEGFANLGEGFARMDEGFARIDPNFERVREEFRYIR
ncbi:hypothetical protein RYX36_036381 [Vicia faba]